MVSVMSEDSATIMCIDGGAYYFNGKPSGIT